jgi:osmotically-inducible protein OsmY
MASSGYTSRDDSTIRQDVLDELEWDSRLHECVVGVAAHDGVVTLAGHVPSYTQKVAAEEAALRVLGVKTVVNEVTVQLHTTAARTDAELAQAAVSALTWDADLPSEAIQVAVSNGWVTLTGKVEVEFQRQEAERVVHRLRGVKGIVNQLSVRTSTPAPDDVKQRIERALVRNAVTDAQHIQVEVHGHRAILRGTVRSYAERRAAEGSTWSAPGIAAVENHLVVTYER